MSSERFETKERLGLTPSFSDLAMPEDLTPDLDDLETLTELFPTFRRTFSLIMNRKENSPAEAIQEIRGYVGLRKDMTRIEINILLEKLQFVSAINSHKGNKDSDFIVEELRDAI